MGSTREQQWRMRAKALIAAARDAQVEAFAKDIRLSAVISVLTPAELADINTRIKAHNAERRARIAARMAAARSTP